MNFGIEIALENYQNFSGCRELLPLTDLSGLEGEVKFLNIYSFHLQVIAGLGKKLFC